MPHMKDHAEDHATGAVDALSPAAIVLDDAGKPHLEVETAEGEWVEVPQ